MKKKEAPLACMLRIIQPKFTSRQICATDEKAVAMSEV